MPLLRKVRRRGVIGPRHCAPIARGCLPDWCPFACPCLQASEAGKSRSPARTIGHAGLRGTSKGAGDARKAPSPQQPAAPAAQLGAAGGVNALLDDYAVVRRSGDVDLGKDAPTCFAADPTMLAVVPVTAVCLWRPPAVPNPLQPVREVVRPANQLTLTEAELEEDIGRVLTAGNPAAPTNLVRYSFRDRGYRPEAIIDQQVQHMLLPGCLMHCDSDEAARQRQRRDSAALAARSRRLTAHSRRVTQAAGHEGKRPSEAGCSRGVRLSELGGGPSATVLHGETSALLPPGEAEHDVQLRNQFNFADRAAQTGHQPPRERSTMTEPPPTVSTSGSCSRWEIFEAYVADQDRQRQAEELARQKVQVARRGAAPQHQQQQQGKQQLPPAAATPKQQQQQPAGAGALVPASNSSQVRGGADT